MSQLEFKEQFEVEGGDLLDETYLEWNRVAGKKKIAAVNFLRAKGHKTMVIIFAVSDESTRYIAQQHLHLACK